MEDYFVLKFKRHSSFCIIRSFLPIPGRILPALTFNRLRPLNVNTGRILPGIGRKCRIMQKLECLAQTHLKVKESICQYKGKKNAPIVKIKEEQKCPMQKSSGVSSAV